MLATKVILSMLLAFIMMLNCLTVQCEPVSLAPRHATQVEEVKLMTIPGAKIEPSVLMQSNTVASTTTGPASSQQQGFNLDKTDEIVVAETNGAQTTSTKLQQQSGHTMEQQQQSEPITIIPLEAVGRRASEKVKKGLSSLLLQWNQNGFYHSNNNVYSEPTASASTSGSIDGSGSDTNIVLMSTPGSEGLVKSASRLTQSRPLGRPLRWG